MRENALELEKLIQTNADLAKLYQEECDRLIAEASDRKKGFFPKPEPDPYNTELGNLVETICYAPDSAGKAKEILKSKATGGIIGWLKQLFISQLHSQLRTITINLANYQERLEKLKEVDPNCQLTSLAEFADFASKKYQRQVESDYESLSPGMTLLENLITTISGVVEINQAKREKRIENAIAAASIGVGTASAAASSIANYAERIVIEIPPFKPTVHPGILAGFTFVISCLIRVGFGGFIWWFLNRK